MAFVDELTIVARAGKGGEGVVRWLHLKGKEYSGPSGGNGGDGGDVYIRGVRDLNLLSRYRGEKSFEAGNGEAGGNTNMAGHRGDDIVIDLPVGSIVKNKETGEVYELLEEGTNVMILKGGRGGAGNAVFKSSVNRRPTESTAGARGEQAELHIELRLIADAGLIGLPNAGKSSLLNAITGAQAKIGAYAFTTLEPNLGALYGYVLADIPGLIEGASEGKGLGFKFLRHIARTRLLVHCIAVDSANPEADYETVRAELKIFDGGVLADKQEVILLTKTDMVEPKVVEKLKKQFEKHVNKGSKKADKKEVLTVSVLDDAAVKALQQRLWNIEQR